MLYTQRPHGKRPDTMQTYTAGFPPQRLGCIHPMQIGIHSPQVNKRGVRNG